MKRLFPIPALPFCLACTGLFWSGPVQAQDNPWLDQEGVVKTPDAAEGEELADRPTITIQLTLDLSPRPEDNGGNLFLVGFKTVDDQGVPTQASNPDDFHQLGIWVQNWPFVQEVQLVEGLHYKALYGYNEYPSPDDMASSTYHTEKAIDGALSMKIVPRKTTEQHDLPEGTPPSEVEIVSKIPEGLQAEPVSVLVNIDPEPFALVGKIFLTGFASYDKVLGMPPRGAEPEHFIVLGADLESLPYSAEAQLRPGFAYFAMMGSGVHPETGDRMSRAVVFEGGTDLQLTITGQEVGKPPEEAPAIAKEFKSPGPGEEATDEPLSKKGRNLFFFIGSAALGGLGGWWLQRRKTNSQGMRSRLERVGESDESS